jgi:hypothetical protein
MESAAGVVRRSCSSVTAVTPTNTTLPVSARALDGSWTMSISDTCGMGSIASGRNRTRIRRPLPSEGTGTIAPPTSSPLPAAVDSSICAPRLRRNASSASAQRRVQRNGAGHRIGRVGSGMDLADSRGATLELIERHVPTAAHQVGRKHQVGSRAESLSQGVVDLRIRAIVREDDIDHHYFGRCGRQNRKRLRQVAPDAPDASVRQGRLIDCQNGGFGRPRLRVVMAKHEVVGGPVERGSEPGAAEEAHGQRSGQQAGIYRRAFPGSFARHHLQYSVVGYSRLLLRIER